MGTGSISLGLVGVAVVIWLMFSSVNIGGQTTSLEVNNEFAKVHCDVNKANGDNCDKENAEIAQNNKVLSVLAAQNKSLNKKVEKYTKNATDAMDKTQADAEKTSGKESAEASVAADKESK